MSYVIQTDTNEREFNDKEEFQDTVDLLEAQGVEYEVIETPQEASQADRPPAEGESILQDAKGDAVDATPVEEDLPESPQVDQDPVEWLPEHFIDTIKGVPTVNRKGYAVIASKYNVSVTAEPITVASETDFEYAEFRAIAVTDDGQEYSGFGSAHVNRQDGDDPHLLNELAETRALKRATAWATGIGMTAIEELQ